MRQIQPPEGQHKTKKILGRGTSSGKGRTSTKGHKGRKARAGGTVLMGFEGGQMKLIMRMPKVGFSNIQHKVTGRGINLSELEKNFQSGEEVTLESLRAKGLLRKKDETAKILATGELTKKLVFSKDIRASAKAKELVVAKGGSFAV